MSYNTVKPRSQYDASRMFAQNIGCFGIQRIVYIGIDLDSVLALTQSFAIALYSELGFTVWVVLFLESRYKTFLPKVSISVSNYDCS